MDYKRYIATTLIAVMGFTLLHAQTQKGKASYYSRKATGSRTANGERLHHDSLTCAHRTYPFGTMLKVTNPANGKEVVVRVTDRGPFTRGRIIDLSYRAAKEIGMLSAGVAMVKVEVYRKPVGIPYKPEEQTVELPEMDFEVTDAGYSFVPQWQDTTATIKKELPRKIKKQTDNPLGQAKATTQPTPPTKGTPDKQEKKEEEHTNQPTIFERLRQWGKDKLK